MIRSLLLAALALLLAVPASAQTNTATFRFFLPSNGSAAGRTALIYADGTDEPPVERVIGADNRVVLENLDPGQYFAYIAPNPDLYVLTMSPLTVDEEGNTFDSLTYLKRFDPEKGAVLGRITLSDTGEPVGNVRFDIGPWDAAPSNVIVDGDGNYAFEMPPGEIDDMLQFTFTFRSLVDIPVAFSIEAGERLTLDLETTERLPGTVRGRVIDADTDAPLSGAFVFAVAVDGSSYGFDFTESDGTYAMAVPENDTPYYIYADYDDPDGASYVQQYFDGVDRVSDATLVTVARDTEQTGFDFALSQPADDFAITLRGTLRATDGTPLTGEAEVFLYGLVSVANLDIADGVFDVSVTDAALAGTQVAVRFDVPGYQSEFFDDSPVAIGADILSVGAQAVTFDLGDVVLLADGEDAPGFAVSGTVTDEESGAPLGGAVVAAQRLDAPGVRYGVASADGSYRIDGLDAGDYAVLFTAADHAPEFFPNADTLPDAQTITLDGDRSGVDGLMGGLNRPVGANKGGATLAGHLAAGRGAPFARTGVLQGVVRGADGQALGGALVTARAGAGVEAFALTDGAGRFSFDLESAAVTVSVQRARFAASQTFVRLNGSGQMLITLTPSNAVSSETAPDRAASALRVFPNPTRSSVTVSFAASAEARVAVYDVLGREVIGATGLGGAAHIDLDTSALAPGVYVVRVADGDVIATQTLTVVR